MMHSHYSEYFIDKAITMDMVYSCRSLPYTLHFLVVADAISLLTHQGHVVNSAAFIVSHSLQPNTR